MGIGTAAALAALGWTAPSWAQEVDDFAAFVVQDGGALVLEHTVVRAEVAVGLAVVDVTQRFHNPFDHPIDATYLFPLPPDAAVRAMSFTCGDRRIEGQILDQAAARARFEQAAAEGRKAALLEQQRPNLFQQSVASLCPGEDVTVALQYVDPLDTENGRTELVFPTTVGKRFRPGEVPEPPFTTVPAHTVSIRVDIAEGVPLDAVWSDTHVIAVAEEDEDHLVVELADGIDLPNRDLQLAWTFDIPTPDVAAVAIPPSGKEAGYLGLTLAPAVLEDMTEVRPRELLFVLDESGSMAGEPFAASVAVVKRALSQMSPADTFDLVRFSNSASALFDRPQPATRANIALAEQWLGVFDGGGTEMTAGILTSLDLPRDPERLRLVLFLTDGYIGDEAQVLDTVRAHIGDARLFSLGVGSAVNRFLLDALADMGRGAVSYQLPGTPVDETVNQFYARIARPALTDLALTVDGVRVTEMYPSVLPDLFVGQPVRVVARYTGDARAATVHLTGVGGETSVAVDRPVALAGAAHHEALTTLWARRKLADLERHHRGDPELLAALSTEVALRHHLVSDYTSLVAVEKTPSPCGPGVSNVDVPSMVPDGVDPALSGSIGGLIGGTTYGAGGLGSRGTGIGGGGIGMSSGASGYGSAGGAFTPQGNTGGYTVADPLILGSLDKSAIDNVIKRHGSQIRYCYQRELVKNAALAGKIVVKFTIGADGTVTEARIASSTVGSASMEDCVRGRFERMAFPAPAGGGVVGVSYPLVFAP